MGENWKKHGTMKGPRVVLEHYFKLRTRKVLGVELELYLELGLYLELRRKLMWNWVLTWNWEDTSKELQIHWEIPNENSENLTKTGLVLARHFQETEEWTGRRTELKINLKGIWENIVKEKGARRNCDGSCKNLKITAINVEGTVDLHYQLDPYHTIQGYFPDPLRFLHSSLQVPCLAINSYQIWVLTFVDVHSL